MPEYVTQGLGLLVHLLEISGASLLIIGFLIATWRWVQRFWKGQVDHRTAIRRYRQSLGRSVLIGLEILVAATIIKTITVEPSFESLGLLAAIIVIRTILSWTTVLEISGRWPWQKQQSNLGD